MTADSGIDDIYSLGKIEAGSVKKYEANIQDIQYLNYFLLVEGKSKHNSCVEGLERTKICQSAKELCHLHEIWSQGWEGGGKTKFGKNMFLLCLLTSLKELK